MTYARLLIPMLLPHLDKVLYIDYDVAIINKGIEWLYNIDFGNKYIVTDSRKLTVFDFSKPYEESK